MPAVALPATAEWLAALAGEPLPGRRQEDWRFTDLAALQAVAPQRWGGSDPFAHVALPAGVTRLDGAEVQTLCDQTLQATGSAASLAIAPPAADARNTGIGGRPFSFVLNSTLRNV